MNFNRIMQFVEKKCWCIFVLSLPSLLYLGLCCSLPLAFLSVLIPCVFWDLCSWTLDFLPHFLDFACVTDSPDFLVWTLACLYLV